MEFLMNYNLVLHIDSGENDKMNLILRNAANYLNALPGEKFEAVIAANGPGVRHFTMAGSEFEEKLKDLAKKGVKFRVCANALADNGITKDSLWPFCEVVPAGLVEIVRLEKAGYAYIKP